MVDAILFWGGVAIILMSVAVSVNDYAGATYMLITGIWLLELARRQR